MIGRGGGSPVPESIRTRAEQTTGADLSGVRLHAGSDSAESAASVGARAYTVGQDVHFGAGEYNPGTRDGDRLIAHELVHTVQQRGDGGAGGGEPQMKLEVSEPGDASEVEADSIADRIVDGGGFAPITQGGGAQISRSRSQCEWDDGTYEELPKQERPPGPPPGWDTADLNPAYQTPRTANYQVEEKDRVGAVEAYQNELATNPDKKMKSASEWAGGKGTAADLDVVLEPADIYFIIGQNLSAIGQGREDKVQAYLDHMAKAFRIMRIDTVEAQALYLAHAAGETVFAYLTEGQIKDKADTPEDKRQGFLDDPDKARITNEAEGPVQYGKRGHASHGSVDPINRISPATNPTYKDNFIGRGPVQVTHDYNYVKTLLHMEEQAKTAAPDDAKLLREAVKAIKEDPRQASAPQYSFLFSAAYMHMAGGVKLSAQVVQSNQMFSGRSDDASASWVAGGGFDIYENARNTEVDYQTKLAAKGADDPETVAALKKRDFWRGAKARAEIKTQAYGRAVQKLTEKMNEAKAKKAAVAQDDGASR